MTAPSLASRREDLRLVTGAGDFVGDAKPVGALHAAFVRSPHAHARIVQLDATAARVVPHVHAVWCSTDLANPVLPPCNTLGAHVVATPTPLLAVDDVCSVGQPVALVVAESRHAAEEAAEAVTVEYDALDVCNDLAGDAHAVVVFTHQTIATAAAGSITVNLNHHQPRLAAVALETRAVSAQWLEGALLVRLSSQSPARARDHIAETCGLPKHQVRVIAPDVGGAFGAKASIGAEELLVCMAAHKLQSAVAWAASRSEEFASGTHGRGALLQGSLRVGAGGEFQHLEARMAFPLGASLPYSGIIPARNAARILPGPYRVGSIDIASRATTSHATATNIYRGAGRPEAALVMETLIDKAARRLQIDPVELRRRNLIPAQAMPWRTPTGETLDSGDYRALLELATARSNYVESRTRQASRRATGDLVGIGIAMYVEPCGQGWERARVTLHADGTANVSTGAPAQGQGHETTYAALAAKELGCTPEQVTVTLGDTAHAPDGIGALASRSMAIGGSALLLACREARTRRDTGETLPLTVETRYEAPGEAWSAGCVIAQVQIARDTGQLTIEHITWADDAGVVLQPALVEGQLIGGLAQGLGQALKEAIVYDEQGQLLTGSLMDYALPRAGDMPPITLSSLSTRATANVLGAKGVGEAGCIGVPAALLNAALDALSPLGIEDLDFPLTAPRLWHIIHANQSTDGSTP